jgi:indole-3-glycerol phosphate synthase
LLPVEELKAFRNYHSTCNSLVSQLLSEGTTGIIAEFKRKSPSKGVINENIQIGPVVEAYDAHGAAGISILTDENYFGGSNDDIIYARDIVSVPILRKILLLMNTRFLKLKLLVQV